MTVGHFGSWSKSAVRRFGCQFEDGMENYMHCMSAVSYEY